MEKVIISLIFDAAKANLESLGYAVTRVDDIIYINSNHPSRTNAITCGGDVPFIVSVSGYNDVSLDKMKIAADNINSKHSETISVELNPKGAVVLQIVKFLDTGSASTFEEFKEKAGYAIQYAMKDLMTIEQEVINLAKQI